MYPTNREVSAFSLVELSIVLVILGLLVGGVLSGQSLIRAAELRAVTTEYQRYYTAAQTFRDKYFAIPGDMTNATAFWGIAGGTGSDNTCRSTVSTDSKTCNGDGSGRLNASVGSYEDLRYWQHLANAGLIEGRYDGASGTLQGFPQSKSGSAAYWAAWYYGPRTSTTSFFFTADYGNYYYVSDGTTSDNLTPAEMWGIDKKLDDGIPYTGYVMSNRGDATDPCTTTYGTTTDTGTLYNLSVTTKVCMALFVRVF